MPRPLGPQHQPLWTPAMTTLGKKGRLISQVLQEHKRWEKMPSRCHPVTEKLLDAYASHLRRRRGLPRVCASRLAHRRLQQWTCAKANGAKINTKHKFKLAPDGSCLAFTEDDFTLVDTQWGSARHRRRSAPNRRSRRYRPPMAVSEKQTERRGQNVRPQRCTAPQVLHPSNRAHSSPSKSPGRQSPATHSPSTRTRKASFVASTTDTSKPTYRRQ